VDHYLIKGWNFKYTDIQAVIGIEQMKKLPYRVERKKNMGRLYEQLLSECDSVELIPTNYEHTVPWFFDALVDRREELIDYLKSKGIGTREFYPQLHSEPAYNLSGDYPVSAEIAQKGLWLPSSITLTDDEIKYVCASIIQFYKGE
jgi:perosamine synthetase